MNEENSGGKNVAILAFLCFQRVSISPGIARRNILFHGYKNI